MIWMTKGQLNTFCSQLSLVSLLEWEALRNAYAVNMKGMRWPMCMESLLGPRPV